MATLGAFKNDNPSGILALNQIQMDSEQFLGASKLGKSSSAWKVCAWCVRCDPLLPRVGNSQCKIPESVYSLLASWFYQCIQFFLCDIFKRNRNEQALYTKKAGGVHAHSESWNSRLVNKCFGFAQLFPWKGVNIQQVITSPPCNQVYCIRLKIPQQRCQVSSRLRPITGTARWLTSRPRPFTAGHSNVATPEIGVAAEYELSIFPAAWSCNLR